MPHLCISGPIISCSSTTIIQDVCCSCFIFSFSFWGNSLEVSFRLLLLICNLFMKDLSTLRNRICQNWPTTQVHLPLDTRHPRRLPLWVVTYWVEAHKCRDVRQQWAAALSWLDRSTRGSLPGRELAAKTRDMLAHLS